MRPRLNRVEDSERSVSLEPKIMQVLVCLADSHGEVVTKERLFAEVWDGAYVTEDVLTRAVGELRRIFGDDPAHPRVIETIRKTGYRLIAVPRPVGEPDAQESRSAAPSPERGAPSRALLPLLFLLGAGVAAIVMLAVRSARRPASAGPMRVRTLTALPGNTRDPAVSPDGTRVAFAWNGGSGDSYSLYVQLVNAETPLRLTHEPGFEDRLPAWSPDGERIAFTRSSADGCEVSVVSSLGGPARALLPCGDGQYRRLAWSPDGSRIAFPSRQSGSPLRIELVSLPTLARQVVTHPPAGILGDSSPSFSPDGRTLAFARNVTEGVSDVYRVSVEGNGEKRLTFDDRDTMGLDWSIDGSSILFSSSRAGIYSLWRVSSDGGDPAWVAGGGAKMKHPSTARARRVIAYENWIYAVNLWRIPSREVGSGEPKRARLTEAGDEWNFAPAFSPSGDRIAFVSTRSGSDEVWTADTEGRGLARLTSFGGARLESPRWSPDGTRLAFSARRKASSEIQLLDLRGGAPERLTSGPSDAVAPDWSRDGKSVYFGSRRGGDWQIWKLDLATRPAAKVTSAGGYAAHESPDGQWLYFSRADAAGIWRQPVRGGPAERVSSALQPEDWANWELAPRGIYFRELCPRHPGPVVALLAFGSSAPVDLVSLSDQGWSGFSVSPDGESIVYPRVDRHASDIRLIENAF